MILNKKLLLLSTTALLMTACVSTKPITHAEFMKEADNASGFTKSMLHITEKNVNVNFSKAISNIKRQSRVCISPTAVSYGIAGSMMPNATVTKRHVSMKKISSRKAQFTIKADEAMMMQPEGGSIAFAADITKTGANRIHIKSVSSFVHENLHDAIEGWSKGSKSCYGIPQ